MANDIKRAAQRLPLQSVTVPSGLRQPRQDSLSGPRKPEAPWADSEPETLHNHAHVMGQLRCYLSAVRDGVVDASNGTLAPPQWRYHTSGGPSPGLITGPLDPRGQPSQGLQVDPSPPSLSTTSPLSASCSSFLSSQVSDSFISYSPPPYPPPSHPSSSYLPLSYSPPSHPPLSYAPPSYAPPSHPPPWHQPTPRQSHSLLPSFLTSDPIQLAPIPAGSSFSVSSPIPTASLGFTVPCLWKNCRLPVQATSSLQMEAAARAHLNISHATDADLSKDGNKVKSCYWTGCHCKKPGCPTVGPHTVHPKIIRSHVVRTHFVGRCREQEKAA